MNNSDAEIVPICSNPDMTPLSLATFDQITAECCRRYARVVIGVSHAVKADARSLTGQSNDQGARWHGDTDGLIGLLETLKFLMLSQKLEMSRPLGPDGM